MKHIFLTICGIIYAGLLFGQAPTPTYQGTTYGWIQNRNVTGEDSGHVFLPIDTGSRDEPIGTLRLKASNNEFYTWTGTRWKWIASTASGGGGSTDSSVFSTNYRVDTFRTRVNTALNTKVNTSDYNSLFDSRLSLKTTDNVAEGANKYYTDARARAAISLTTTGTSGAATYNSSTGVLNIPQYAAGTGTVTSIATTNGTGIIGGTITTSGTLALDTTNTVSTKDYRRKGTDSLGVIIATKLNITDTANMRVRLAAGSNITLTGTYPNITIAASGGGGGGADTQAYHYTGDSYSGNLRLGSSGSGTRRLAMYLNSDTLLRLGVTSGGFRWGIFNSNSSTANNYEAVVIGGENNEASGIRSVVIGGIGGKAQGTNSIGMNGGKAEASGSVAIGTLETYANGTNSTSIGSYTSNNSFSGCLNLSGYGEASFSQNTANNQLVARFTGGYIFRTSSGSDIVTIKPSGVINLKISYVYPDNAAAIAGGLVAGDMYRTSTGDLKIVY